MKTITPIIVILATAVAIRVCGGTCSDEALRGEILRFMRPIECCEMVRGQTHRPRVLTDRISFDGDTNRLARLLAELAQTNNVQIAQRSMTLLAKYGTIEQLPILYSCATNPAVGDKAVKAVLSIEGVTSNSIEVARAYLFQTNRFPYANISDRSNVCRDLIARVSSDSDLIGFRSNVLDMVQFVAKDFDLLPSVLDTAVISEDPGFRYSKRRLAILRAAMQRQNIEYQDIVSSNNEVWKRTYVHSFQTNYLQNAINELVAYPEANLPD